MDRMLELIKSFSVFKDSKTIFIRTIPNIIDFTKFEGCIEISDTNNTLSIDTSLENFKLVLTVIASFSMEKLIITYDFKKFMSYTYHLFGNKKPKFKKLFDLRIIESFLNKNGTHPESYGEAIIRFKNIVNDSSWHKVYQEIHMPLLLEVIPCIENRRLVYNKSMYYTNYEIEGQAQGRLSCSKISDKYLNPHTLERVLRKDIKVKDGYSLINFDYSHMEVSVLQWLAKDDDILEILKNNDFYCSLYKDLFYKECSNSSRAKIKAIFLPLVYGAGNDTLAESTGIDVDSIKKIIKLIRNRFSKLFEWLDNQNEATDYFGRKRILEHKYQIRNFLVQSTSAMVCQHKLIQLYRKKYDILFNIHDGYAISVCNQNSDYIINDIVCTLEKQEALYPGLRLRATYSKES